MSSPLFLPSIFSIVLLLLCGLGFLVIAGFRTLRLGSCQRCGAAKVRSSAARHWQDKLAAAFLLKPYRCAGCRTRFYAFRTISVPPSLPVSAIAAAPVQDQPPKRPFRIRVKVIVKLPRWEEVPAWLVETVD